MGCIPWADGCIIGNLPTTRNGAPPGSAVLKKGTPPVRDALLTAYITDAPEGKRLAVLATTPASVASAPREGVACNDAAARRDRPTIGWVRDARVRSQERNTNSQ